ncbi:tripartite motif-containing protein 47-like isoform X1 [Poecilia latipinna]|uniref:Tripartite motif-containing protein 47-like n=2 Tax=Poecilia TaxID=8080 RepID=A0A3B3W254_9TELE|nr:PREDICTED: tripartite motif-containing protein 47-like isoform X1 [Poecilia mexicana]XP_014912785.1 PREDICTED: tripartite motif-containing protein 47-like isoform X1 [Poecilia latipinna]
MAENPPEHGVDLDQSQFCCSVCLDLFREPVTVPCGHSYCRRCIETCWQRDEEAEGRYSCPQCREVFQPRPVLRKNITLAEVVGKLKVMGTMETPLFVEFTCAGPDDVACDFCCESRRHKASMSCLTCLASYCSFHLASHYTVPALETHQLVSVTVPLKEKMCKKHKKLLEVYCQSDKRCICYLCIIDEHRGHFTVPASAERATEQILLNMHQIGVQRSLQNRENELRELGKALEDFKVCSRTAVDNVDKTINMLISSIQMRRILAKQMMDMREKLAIAEAEKLQLQLQEEITKLRKRNGDLQKLSLSSDHIHFIQTFPALSTSCESPDLPPGAVVRPRESMAAASRFLDDLKDKVDGILEDSWSNFSATVSAVNVVLPPVPKTREQFLLYGCVLTLDIQTAHKCLSISKEQQRDVSVSRYAPYYVSRSDMFESVKQVLCCEALSERCYWEVTWEGSFCAVAVAYKDIARSSSDSEFGCNDKSWSLECSKDSYVFRHRSQKKVLSGPLTSWIGVYLDYRSGTLAFYSISKEMMLLHREQTMFCKPLYPGLGLKDDVQAKLVKLW